MQFITSMPMPTTEIENRRVAWFNRKRIISLLLYSSLPPSISFGFWQLKKTKNKKQKQKQKQKKKNKKQQQKKKKKPNKQTNKQTKILQDF